MAAAMSCRLHEIGVAAPARGAGAAGLVLSGNDMELPPPRDAIELGERINVFWAAFVLDRCWSVALGAPSALVDEHPPAMSIRTPLPRRMEEYASVSVICAYCRTCANFSLDEHKPDYVYGTIPVPIHHRLKRLQRPSGCHEYSRRPRRCRGPLRACNTSYWATGSQ